MRFLFVLPILVLSVCALGASHGSSGGGTPVRTRVVEAPAPKAVPMTAPPERLCVEKRCKPTLCQRVHRVKVAVGAARAVMMYGKANRLDERAVGLIERAAEIREGAHDRIEETLEEVAND